MQPQDPQSGVNLLGFQKSMCRKAAIALYILGAFDFLCWMSLLILTSSHHSTSFSVVISVIFTINLMSLYTTGYLAMKASRKPTKNEIVPMMVLSMIASCMTFIMLIMSLVILGATFDSFNLLHIVHYSNIIAKFASMIVCLYLTGISCGSVCCNTGTRYQPTVIYTQAPMQPGQQPPQYLAATSLASGYAQGGAVTNAPIYVPSQVGVGTGGDPLGAEQLPIKQYA